jgi:hypothetical protein
VPIQFRDGSVAVLIPLLIPFRSLPEAPDTRPAAKGSRRAAASVLLCLSPEAMEQPKAVRSYDMPEDREALRPYVADMVALEKHILEAVERQREDESLQQFPAAKSLVLTIETTLRQHVAALENHVAALPGGSAAAAVKSAVTGALGAVAGLYDKIRSEPVSRMLRDDYTALALASISYTMLHTTALAFKQTATADIALRHLQDLTPLLLEVGDVIPTVVVKELARQGYPLDDAAVAQAARRIKEVWQEASQSKEKVGEPVGVR